MGSFLFSNGVYDKVFYNWGPPVKFVGVEIDDNKTFYLILTFTFFHQLINNIVNQITYPWIINCVQDPKSETLYYHKSTSLFLVNLFNIYSEIDCIIIIVGITSQVSFLFAIILANIISSTVINYQYIWKKRKPVCHSYENSTLPDMTPFLHRGDACTSYRTLSL